MAAMADERSFSGSSKTHERRKRNEKPSKTDDSGDNSGAKSSGNKILLIGGRQRLRVWRRTAFAHGSSGYHLPGGRDALKPRSKRLRGKPDGHAPQRVLPAAIKIEMKSTRGRLVDGHLQIA